MNLSKTVEERLAIAASLSSQVALPMKQKEPFHYRPERSLPPSGEMRCSPNLINNDTYFAKMKHYQNEKNNT